MNLTKKTLHNISILGGIRIFAKILNAFTLIILARLLSPSDFGIVAVSMILISITWTFKDFGVQDAIIQRKGDTNDAINTGFFIRTVIAILVFSIIFLFAPVWGNYYNDQNVTEAVRFIAIIIVISSLRFVPETKLIKELNFKIFAIPELLGRIVYAGVAILLAYLGYSFWSLIYGRIAQSVVHTITMWIVRPWKFNKHFNVGIAKELFSYGKHIFLIGLLTFAITNLDKAAIGKIVGFTAVGYYLIAYRWASFGSSEMYQAVDRVMFPTYSSINEDLSRVGHAYLKTLKFSSMISIPITLGTLAIAPEFILVLLGEKWVPAILPLQILCIKSLFQSFLGTAGSVYKSIGKPEILSYFQTIQLILLAILILPIANRYGVVGVAVLVASTVMFLYPFHFSLITRYLSLRRRSVLEILLPQTLSGLIMAFSIFLLKNYLEKIFLSFSAGSVMHLISLVLFGVIVYTVFLFILTKGRLKDDLKILTSNLRT